MVNYIINLGEKLSKRWKNILVTKANKAIQEAENEIKNISLTA